jgi:signal transduction histidine kinase
MRLALKIFLSSALVVGVVGAVGALSLRAIGRVVDVNREIVGQTLPAVRLTAAVREAMPALARLESRFLVLRDPRFRDLWTERAGRAAEDLRRLAAVVQTEAERAPLAAAAAALGEYRAVVERGHALLGRGDRAGALRLAEGEAREAVERVEEHLEALLAAVHARVDAAQAEAQRLERRTWSGVVGALAAAVALALAGTAVVAVRITRSLRALSQATTAVAAGAFREPVPVGGDDEIGGLARAFNTMAGELRRIDRMKEEFFATISHELRSPLTSVREAAHLLADQVAGPLTPRQARLVEIVGRSSDRLLGLVNRILDLGRLRAGVLPLAREPVALDAVVARAAEELRPQAEEAGVQVTQERAGGDAGLEGDGERLHHVVVNLLANAIRFTPKGGRVTLTVRDAGAAVELVVADTGIGIPAEALPHVFDPYRQAHTDRGGTGLGLAIVRGIVQAHGGEVRVESEEGRGTRVAVRLPRTAAEAAA